MRVDVAPPALRFRTLGAQASHGFATPVIELAIEIACDPTYEIRAVALNVDVRIAAQRRRYDAPERERLGEIFGNESQWAQSLGSIQWMRGALNVPRFEGSTVIRVPLPCSYDFDVAAAKYLAALESGEIPVEALFSGAIFYAGANGNLQTAMIPWESESAFRIPVATWREAMDTAFPQSAWIRVADTTLRKLQAYRSRRAHADWDVTLDELLDGARH
jgi:hypothetical protein